jgi:type IV pilus assembly protein PilM
MAIVTANASDYFPVDMNQYHLVYNVLGTVDGEDGTKQHRLSLLAVPNDVTTSYIDLAKSLELEITAIDYVGNSVFQAVKEDVSHQSTATCFLKVEEHASLITVIYQGEIVLQRQIAHGLNQAIENLMESDMFQDEELSYAGASRKFVENKIIRPHLNLDAGVSAEDANEEDLMIRVMITESLRYLCGNVSRVVEYFVSRNEDKPLGNIYLVGLGADFQGLPELLSNEIGQNVSLYEGLNKFTAINVDPNAPAVSMNQMIGPIGAATNPLQLLSSDLLKEEKEINLILPAAIFVIGVAAMITMIIVGSIMLKSAKNKTEKMDKELHSYDWVADAIKKYEDSKVTYEQLKAMVNVGDNWNNELVAFIEEMEEKMPVSFSATGFTVSSTGITMVTKVATKEEAAKVIEQFRTFKSVAVIGSGSFTENDVYVTNANGELVTVTDEVESTDITFSVSLAYTSWASRNTSETEEKTE